MEDYNSSASGFNTQSTSGFAAVPQPASSSDGVAPEPAVTQPYSQPYPQSYSQPYSQPYAADDPADTSPFASSGSSAPASASAAAASVGGSGTALAVPIDDPGLTSEFPPVGATVDEEPTEKGVSIITREATVLGNIITDGHIDIVGRVRGNVDAKGDVAVHGIVRGDVGGEKIGLYNCRVKGNLDAAAGVIVDEGSVIGGDIATKNIIFDGKIKGNINADNVVVLRSHSYCLGDVSAASLAVEPGTVLNGMVRTMVAGDLEAPFDEVM
ncbi:MAG: polymer-forming cytoskeletal protein [Coriobacteriales bacterium]|jgi:cytoskeletal protein CcmA (bactofilin family)|nr:polymer-forming cytoskeletal protein [Coriobacteriales bacterium]